jgi:uncharacterized membrane protein YfcA
VFDFLLYAAMFCASAVSGMLGIGVAFAAVPILGIGDMDLVNAIQPIALFLNGVTALFSAVSFARAGYVDWRRAMFLAFVCSVFSPLGAAAALAIGTTILWAAYFSAVAVVVGLLWRDRPAKGESLSFTQVLWLSVPVSALSGLLGVGPGFLIVPLMVYAGFGARRAAALNAVAVVPASFLSLIPHLAHASVDAAAALPIVLCAAAGAFLGGYLSSTRIPEAALRRLFIVVIVALSAYKAVTLVDAHSRQAAAAARAPALAR